MPTATPLSSTASSSKMVLSVKCSLSEDDFSTNTLHPDNVILVAFDGPEAAKTPLSVIKNFLVEAARLKNIEITQNSLVYHYRDEEPCRVFFPLPPEVDATTLHGSILIIKAKITFHAMIPGREPKKIFLNYVPPYISKTGFNKLCDLIAPPDKVHYKHRRHGGRMDRHLILAETTEDTVPHFIETLDTRTGKTHRIAVTMTGRLPLCAECGVSEHDSNQCPSKRQPATTRQTEDNAQPPPTTSTTRPPKRHHPSTSSSESSIDLSTSPTAPETVPPTKTTTTPTPDRTTRTNVLTLEESKQIVFAHCERHGAIIKVDRPHCKVTVCGTVLGVSETMSAIELEREKLRLGIKD